MEHFHIQTFRNLVNVIKKGSFSIKTQMIKVYNCLPAEYTLYFLVESESFFRLMIEG